MTPPRAMSIADRFWSHVVKGPAAADCWIWTGAIGDDGYGRFWVPQPGGGQRAMRPQRWLYEQVEGEPLDPSVMLLHACDVPLCVHVDTDATLSHLAPGTHRGNMIERSQRGRHRNGATALHTLGVPRAERVRRSRDLRAAFRAHGWDTAALSAARSGVDVDS